MYSDTATLRALRSYRFRKPTTFRAYLSLLQAMFVILFAAHGGMVLWKRGCRGPVWWG